MSDQQPIEEKCVFAVGEQGGVPLIVVAVPRKAWRYMRDGKTHTFDLTEAGIPCKLILFGAVNHDSAMKVIDGAAKASGSTYQDARNKDFSIRLKPDGV